VGRGASRVHGSRAGVSRDPRRSAPRACVRLAPHALTLPLEARKDAVLPETSTDLRERTRQPWRRRRLTLVLVTRRHSLSRSKGGSRGKSASRVHGSRARVSRDPRRSAPRACVRPAPHSRVLTLPLEARKDAVLPETSTDLRERARKPWRRRRLALSSRVLSRFEARKDAVLPETSTDLRERARKPWRRRRLTLVLVTRRHSLSRSKRGRTRSCRRPPQACASGHASRGGDDVSLSSSALAVTRSRVRSEEGRGLAGDLHGPARAGTQAVAATTSRSLVTRALAFRSEEGRGLAGDLHRPARAGTQAVEATTSRSRPRHSPSLALAFEARKPWEERLARPRLARSRLA
jgi:hypothetical protein